MLSHSDIIDDEIKSLLATLPGFRDYQERLPEPDLESLLTKYEQSLRQSDKLTYGIRTNIKLIKRKYNEQKSKASESSPEKKDENGEICYVIGVLKAIRKKLGKKDGDTIHVVITER